MLVSICWLSRVFFAALLRSIVPATMLLLDDDDDICCEVPADGGDDDDDAKSLSDCVKAPRRDGANAAVLVRSRNSGRLQRVIILAAVVSDGVYLTADDGDGYVDGDRGFCSR